MSNLEQQIRLRTFEWLGEQVSLHGDVLPRALLQQGFEFEGERVPLLSPQGIFKPWILEFPLSITTAPRGPYDDNFSPDGFLLYRYRGTDTNHRDNVGLRGALLRSIPLVYFHGIVPGKYLAVWPVYIIGDEPASLIFKVAVDDMSAVQSRSTHTGVAEMANTRRAYITTIVKQRLHQRGFRERVLHAYREQCALCRLGHQELLDAAHIVPDTEPHGSPIISNGISLCKLHHAAFDASLLGIAPDYTVEIRDDILNEQDGPMLQHGLKERHRARIVLPGKREYWPNRDLLDWRYQKFRAVA